MNIKKNWLFSFLMTICSTINLYSMQGAPDPQQPQAQQPAPDPQPAQQPANPQEELTRAQTAYYQAKTTAAENAQKISEEMNSIPGVSKQEGVKQGIGLVVRGAERTLNYGFDEARKRVIGLSDSEKLEKEIQELDRDIKKESLISQQNANKNADQVEESNKLQQNVFRKQELNHDIDAIEKLASKLPGGSKNPEVKRRLRELAKLAGMDIPEEKKKEPTDKKDKIGLISKLMTPFFALITTSGNCADFLANHSFAHITNLNCFKDTFIQTHAKHINRALVATTIVGIGFVVYKLYDKYTNADDDEYDNDKEDDDE